MDAQERSGSEVWDVPYLSIDPKDVGRSYEAIIRVNSQSGKGGVAYLMAVDHNLELPRGLQVDFARRVQQITDARGGELTGAELMEAFSAHYLDHVQPYELVAYTHSSEEDSDQIAARVRVDGEERVIEGEGNGPLAALVDAFAKAFGVTISIRDYHEHAMAASVDAKAAAYVEADVGEEAFWGVGVHGSILTASLRAIVNAVNRSVAARDAAAEAVAEGRSSGSATATLRGETRRRRRARRPASAQAPRWRIDSRHVDQRSPTKISAIPTTAITSGAIPPSRLIADMVAMRTPRAPTTVKLQCRTKAEKNRASAPSMRRSRRSRALSSGPSRRSRQLVRNEPGPVRPGREVRRLRDVEPEPCRDPGEPER